MNGWHPDLIGDLSRPVTRWTERRNAAVWLFRFENAAPSSIPVGGSPVPPILKTALNKRQRTPFTSLSYVSEASKRKPRQTMKTLLRFIHRLFHRPKRKPTASADPGKKVDGQPAKNLPERVPDGIANDDSPPGYKTRWHH
jgi:hypothetical protein